MANPIGTVLQTAMAGVTSQGQSTTGLPTSTPNLTQSEAEILHKRAFLQTFRRWEVLFARKEGDLPAEKWLIAEYYDSLRHLSAEGFDALTSQLKARCTFFPRIAECLEATRPKDQYDYIHAFCKAPHLFLVPPVEPVDPLMRRFLAYKAQQAALAAPEPKDD